MLVGQSNGFLSSFLWRRLCGPISLTLRNQWFHIHTHAVRRWERRQGCIPDTTICHVPCECNTIPWQTVKISSIPIFTRYQSAAPYVHRHMTSHIAANTRVRLTTFTVVPFRVPTSHGQWANTHNGLQLSFMLLIALVLFLTMTAVKIKWLSLHVSLETLYPK